MADRPTRHPGCVSPTLFMALLALLPGTARPALPPAQQDAPAQDSAQQSVPAAADAAPPSGGSTWFLPPIRFGGVLSYNIRSDITEEQKSMQQGLSATLRAATNTFIWQPWFARVDGGLGLTMSRESSSANESGNSSNSVIITGNGQLAVLPRSKYPFEAHFDRSDSRVSSDLALAYGYESQRYGFTQQYFMERGNAMFGWDRNTQTSPGTGRDLQDSVQLNLSQALKNNNLRLSGNGTRNTREQSGETATQSNVSLQHSYAPGASISVENMANISRSGFHLQQGDSNTRLRQLSSLGFWRPTDQALTVNGGARVLALETDTTTGLAVGNNSIRNANVNLGVNYELTPFTRLNAGANVNLVETNGERSTNTNQSVGATYSPAPIELGSFRYNWSTSAGASNQTGEQGSSRQFTLQLSHNLGRSYKLDGGSTVSVDGSQSLGVAVGSSSNGAATEPTQQLTHSGSIAWDLSQQSGATQVRLSVSDSRSLGGNQAYFQLINFQASSNLQTGRFSSWTGNLTIQGSRQGENATDGNTVAFGQPTNTAADTGFESTSSASISYQNQRMFGVPRLRFASDLRLNSAALLPLLGSAKDQETAAWDNRFDYAIGRTQLRLQALISRSGTPDGVNVESRNKIYKSIMFSVSRSFGNF